MSFLLGCLNTRRLLVFAMLLLWPPLVILAARKSHQADVFGWWSYRVFTLLACGALVLLVASVFVVWCLRSDAAVRRFDRMIVAIRKLRMAAIFVAVLSVLGWLAVVGFLEMISVRPSLPLLIALLDLAMLVLVWEAVLIFAGRDEQERRLMSKKCLLAGGGILLAVVAVEIAGNALGLAAYAHWELNPKDLHAHFRTQDFDTTVVTNSQGLRHEREVPKTRDDTLRVVVVGDSMTFGWGVENREAYPRVAELLLREKYGRKQVEIINMGKPGAAPGDYLRFIRNYASRLNPDIVVVGFLIGNDCPVVAPAQLASRNDVRQAFTDHLAASRLNWVEQVLLKSYFVRLLYAGLLPRLRGVGAPGSDGQRGPIFGEPNPLSAPVLSEQIDGLPNPAAARRRYELLRKNGWIEKGLDWRVNPWLIRSMILHPAGPADSLALRPETKDIMRREWQLCEELLREMKATAEESGAKFVVLAIPAKHAVSGQWLATLRQFGCEAPAEMTSSRIMIDWLIQFCRENEIGCVDAVEPIRAENEQGEELYFETDDHMTRKGHRLLAELMAGKLNEMIRAAR